MATNLRTEIKQIDGWIKEGQSRLAIRALEKIRSSKIPRALALPIASLARRVNLTLLAVRLLHPYVRPANRSMSPATAGETAEYAAALSYLGATGEALSLLQTVPVDQVPQALLYQSFALFAQWQYRAAIPLLDRYLKSKELDPYARLVGNVNLAAALVFEGDYPRAESILTELMRQTTQPERTLLRGNVLELLAQATLFQRRYEKAQNYLQLAAEALQNSGGLSALLVQKWTAILQLLRQPKSVKDRAALHQVRKEGKARRNGEVVRDCDLFDAVTGQSAELFLQVYFGTPFEPYRARALSLYGVQVDLPSRYVWNPFGGKPPTKVLNLAVPESMGRGIRPPTPALFRLLQVFALDFYRSHRLPTLFGWLYPSEHFNPTTSGARTYRILERLREWFKQNRLPFVIEETNGFYRLGAHRAFGIELGRKILVLEDETSRLLNRLRQRWPKDCFSAADVGQYLKLSPRTTQRLLRGGVEIKQLTRLGASSATHYRFC